MTLEEIPYGEGFNNIPVETQVHLLRQTVYNMQKDVDKTTEKVNTLEKSEAVTQQQLKMVFASLDDIKQGQDSIITKLEDKDKEDKEALKNTIKQNRELKLLVIGAVITTLASIIIPILLNTK